METPPLPFTSFILTWLRLFLVCLPIAVTGYSIYYVVLVCEPIFIDAIGAGNAVLGALIIITSLCSMVSSFISLKKPDSIQFNSWHFSMYIISTIIGILLIVIALVMTCTESQSINSSKISNYANAFPNSASTNKYQSSFGSNYKKLLYAYAFGLNSYEAYLIIGIAWIMCFVAFFTIAELFMKTP